jgi:hypothetical protein
MSIVCRKQAWTGWAKRFAAVALAGLLAGCVDSLPHSALPDLGKEKRPLLTAEQQKAAIGDLNAKKEAKKAEALKEIESRH